MERTCINCKATFEVEKKRGRPHTKCEKCRKIPKTNPCLEIPAPELGPGEKRPTQLGAWEPKSKKSAKVIEEKPKRFKDTSMKGNERYSRSAFVAYMDEHGVPIGARAVAEAINHVKEG